LSDINLTKLIQYHKFSNAKATITAIQPPGRYGALNIESGRVSQFQEKPAGDGSWINGGFFVLEPSVLDYIQDDNTTWEESPLKTLAKNGELNAFHHTGFWQAMDTLREKNLLENLWASGQAPWKSWV
jgi:glucose-1-phosphate cytidylyltransferase